MTWTQPSDLREQVQRLWDSGKLLASVATGEPLFPLRLTLRCPTASEIGNDFDSVRKWVGELQGVANIRLEMRERSHRIHGVNLFPSEVWLDSLDAAAALIGVRGDLLRFTELVELTCHRQPLLVPWLAKRPLWAVGLAEVWQQLLAVVDWVQVNPRSGVYLRQVDTEDVHSKFIETHRTVLQELLDLVLPTIAIDRSAVGVGQFNRRYGFLDKPALVRFRVLDVNRQLLPCEGIQDVTLDRKSFARIDASVANVFIVENEINFLSFPTMPDAMVIFGAGYGFDAIKDATWLGDRSVYYWGDIDTHGFAILDQLRSTLPLAKSFLMDRSTLLAHRAHWTVEPQPQQRELSRLDNTEHAVYEDLRYNRVGRAVRLEQERIGFGWFKEALALVTINSRI
jgi:hypothetical protein